MEMGQSSGSKPSGDDVVWAKLIPMDSSYSEIELKLNETVICSEVTSLEKQAWCKITRGMDLVSATIQNTSSNTILVDEKFVLDDQTAIVKCGSEISPSFQTEGSLKYKFEVMPVEESYKHLKVSVDVEHAKCSICLNIWHDVVTVAPCLHNFCNGCFSEWLRRSQEKHSSVKCPECRAVVQFVGKNPFLHNIEENILEADPSLKRPSEDIKLIDSYASIKSPLVLNSGKRSKRKRAHSPSDEASRWELPCRQCGTEFGGFQCNQSTVHLQCHACGGMMPLRTNISIPQHCIGCDRAFCAAYWHAQGTNGSDLHPICSPETFKPITERTITRIPSLAHEKNRHEQEITERCITKMGRPLQDVVSDWILKLDNREIDRTRMPLNHAEMITARTPCCSECYDKIVSFLLYWFRVTMPKHCLPAEGSQREDCWYGYACRTQHHNEEHARKRNHVCRPTRGSQM
nr:E3 ubiquitin-protein ligase CHFR [Ipomoea batatas]